MGAAGVSPIRCGGYVNLANAKLQIDGTAYTGGPSLIDLFVTPDVLAASTNIQVTGLGVQGIDYTVIQDVTANVVRLQIGGLNADRAAVLRLVDDARPRVEEGFAARADDVCNARLGLVVVAGAHVEHLLGDRLAQRHRTGEQADQRHVHLLHLRPGPAATATAAAAAAAARHAGRPRTSSTPPRVRAGLPSSPALGRAARPPASSSSRRLSHL